MTTIKVDVSGLSELIGQLSALGAIADEVIEETVFDVATDTQAIAIAGLDGPPKTGRVYEFYYFTDAQGRLRQGEKRPSPHQASAAGEYPATDRGRLAGSVRALPDGPLAYVVGTNVEYGPMLEFGTSRMAARPWLLPSFERAKINVAKELRARLEAML